MMRPSEEDRLLRQLEERLLRSEPRKASRDVEPMLDARFVEFGSSGLAYDRMEMIAALGRDGSIENEPAPVEITDFSVRRLATDAALLTYSLRALRADGAGADKVPAQRRSGSASTDDGSRSFARARRCMVSPIRGCARSGSRLHQGREKTGFRWNREAVALVLGMWVVRSGLAVGISAFGRLRRAVT